MAAFDAEFDDNLDDLGPGRERDDDRDQGGYRVTVPSTGQDTGSGERMPAPASDVGFRGRTPEGTLPIAPDDLHRLVATASPNSAAMPAASPGAPAAGAQPPDMKDLLRQSSGVPSVISAGLPKGAPPPSIASVVPPSPAAPPAGVMRPPLAPTDVPKPPVGQNNQRRIDLLKQMGTLGKPTDPKAVDANGKPMYRMSLGQRILGTIGNAATGFGRRGGPITYVGPGATNRQFDVAENQREKTLGGVKEELGEQDKLDTSEEKTYQDAVRQAYEGQLGQKATELGAAAEKNMDIRGQLESSQAEKNAAIAERDRALGRKADQPKQPSNEVELVQAFQSETDPKKKAALKGAIDQLSSLKNAGKDTSAADLAKIIAINNQKQNLIDRVDKEKEAERTRRYAELRKNYQNYQLNDPKTRTEIEQKQAGIDQELETKYSKRTQDASDEADKLFGLTKKGGALKSTPTPAAPPQQVSSPPTLNARRGTSSTVPALPAPAAAAPAAAPAKAGIPAKAPKAGDAVTVKGKQYTVGKVYPNGSWDPK